MAFGLSGALAGLSAVEGGYQQGMSNEYKLDDQKRAALARVAMGNALSLIGGGQGGGGTPQPQFQQPQAPQPGIPSQPMQRPGMSMGAPPGAPLTSPTGGGPPGPAAGGPGGMPGSVGGPAPPMMQRPGMTPGGAPAQGGLPQGNQPMDWRSIVAAVKQANPNLPPEVLAEAVNQFLPMMNANSQQEWRMISLQLREQALQQRESQFMMGQQTKKEEGAANRVSRETIAKMTVDERREAMEAGLITKQEIADAQIASREKEGEANRGSREKIADKRVTEQELVRTGRERMQQKRLDQQQSQFEERESRLGAALELRADTTYQRLEQQKQQAIQKAEASQGKQGLAEIRAAIDAQDKHVRTRIQAYSAANTMKPAERKALLDQAEMDYNEQIARLRERFGGSKAGGASRSDTSAAPGGSPPATTLPPEARAALKEGQVTTFQNGQKWTLRNGQPEQVP